MGAERLMNWREKAVKESDQPPCNVGSNGDWQQNHAISYNQITGQQKLCWISPYDEGKIDKIKQLQGEHLR